MNDYVGHYIGPRVIDHTNGMKYPVDKIVSSFFGVKMKFFENFYCVL